MIRKIRRTSKFKRDIKHLIRSGKNVEKMLLLIDKLAHYQPLPIENFDHPLHGKYNNKRDCHIEPDWVLIYAIEDDELVLYRTGSHAHLFK